MRDEFRRHIADHCDLGQTEVRPVRKPERENQPCGDGATKQNQRGDEGHDSFKRGDYREPLRGNAARAFLIENIGGCALFRVATRRSFR